MGWYWHTTGRAGFGQGSSRLFLQGEAGRQGLLEGCPSHLGHEDRGQSFPQHRVGVDRLLRTYLGVRAHTSLPGSAPFSIHPLAPQLLPSPWEKLWCVSFGNTPSLWLLLMDTPLAGEEVSPQASVWAVNLNSILLFKFHSHI